MNVRTNIVMLFILIVLLSCSGDASTNLQGTWAVWDVYKNGLDISGIDKSDGSFVSNTMDINSDFIILPVLSKDPIVAKYRMIEFHGRDAIEIYKCDEEQFLGVYLYQINLLKEFNNGANKVYKLEMQSDSIYIKGTKTVVNLM